MSTEEFVNLMNCDLFNNIDLTTYVNDDNKQVNNNQDHALEDSVYQEYIVKPDQ